MLLNLVNHLIIAVVIVIVKTIINCYSFDFIIIINLYTINVCLQNSEVLNLPLSPI
jgi:hypothetical protein